MNHEEHRLYDAPSSTFGLQKLRQPLIPLTPELQRRTSEDTIVTATERQASELRYSWGYAQSEVGKAAWITPDIQSFDSWIRSVYDQLERAGWHEAYRGLLNPAAMHLAFRMCVPDEEFEKHTESVVNAWRLYCDWNLHLVLPDIRQTENGRLFTGWVENFKQFAQENEVVTTPELTALVNQAVVSGIYAAKKISFFGRFDWTPVQRELCRSLERQGCKVNYLDSQSLDESSHNVVRFDSPQRERASFAYWARERLLGASEQTRIAIVLPDIVNNYSAVLRHLEAAFFDVAQLETVANIGSGIPLNETRLCQDLLTFLAWTTREMSYEQIIQIGRSPFLKNLELPHEFSGSFPDRIRFNGFAFRSNSDVAKHIARQLSPRRKSVNDWIETIYEIFQWVGWDAATHSDENQRSLTAFIDVLNNVAKLSAFVPRASWGEVVSLIRNAAKTHQLPYISRNAPVQVLSRYDSEGLSFDHLWVAGLGENTWPPEPNPNPMIPIPVQRKAIIPRVNHAQMLRWALDRTHNWIHSAPDVVFSCSREDEESESQESRLLRDSPTIALVDLHKTPSLVQFDHPWGSIRQYDALREYLSDYATPITPDQFTPSTSFVRDQSNCPFRAWAIHRAGLKDRQKPHRFPDAIDRGTYLHNTLEILLQSARTQEEIGALQEHGIERAIDRAFSGHLRRLPVRFVNLERERIQRIVQSWIAFECSRNPFEVMETESDHQLKLRGFELQFRVDRVDRTDDLSALVVDYKTGNAQVSDWQTPRPREPQMPLYSLAVTDCDALAYQKFEQEKISLVGAGASEQHHKGVVKAESRFKGVATFRELQDNWHNNLLEIVDEFAQGHATVSPSNTKICNHCHLMNFCRKFTDVELAIDELVEIP